MIWSAHALPHPCDGLQALAVPCYGLQALSVPLGLYASACGPSGMLCKRLRHPGMACKRLRSLWDGLQALAHKSAENWSQLWPQFQHTVAQGSADHLLFHTIWSVAIYPHIRAPVPNVQWSAKTRNRLGSTRGGLLKTGPTSGPGFNRALRNGLLRLVLFCCGILVRPC